MKPRIYPATDDGTPNGKPVFLSQERWDQIKNDQRSTVSAQMLLNPIAGSEATFLAEWLRPYEVIPEILNVYILCDPSMGVTERSDRSAIVVVGVDQGGSKYLIDGVCHRMKLSERWEFIKQFRRKWLTYTKNNQLVRVGYERYGMQSDIEVMNDMMEREREWFEIFELGTPRKGLHAKPDRIRRLEPDIRDGRFYFPCLVYNADVGAPGNHLAYWQIWNEERRKAAEVAVAAAEAGGNVEEIKRFRPMVAYSPGQIVYRPALGPTKAMREARENRRVTALQRRDETGQIYDVTKLCFDELVKHPFSTHDDFIDAMSRIYDIDPQAPVQHEQASTEPLDMDAETMTEA